jgi:hypothetical protein
MADITPQRPTEEAAALRRRLLAALKTQVGLRQAIMTAEVLAPPVAKRRVRSHLPTRASSASPTGKTPG